jgi:hypothetical protein
VEISIVSAQEVWAKRGRNPREVSPQIIEALKKTYRTGNAGVIPVRNAIELREAREFLVEARRAARQMGDHVRVACQPRPHEITTELRFMLVDKESHR